MLACPRCDATPLADKDRGYACPSCKTEYPMIGDIPWLFAEPDASLAEWRNRLHFELQSLNFDCQKIVKELQDKALSPLTRSRLENRRAAFETHRDALRKLLTPVDVQSMTGTYESYLALRTRLPSDQGLQTYYANVHRDWAWGATENAASLAQIRNVMERSGSSQPGDTLVLGAGACRLPYDIHTELKATRTIAVDFNPLLLLIANRVMHGEALQMIEFPIAPKSADDGAIQRTLSAPSPVDGNFALVLCDVLRAPFRDGQFDTVVTPWLIDIVSEDLAIFSARINSLLKPGGRWINFGSLAFDHPRHARRYSPEEVLAIVGESGFDAVVSHEENIPYMCSPASRHGRTELVFSFSASKKKSVKKASRHKALPDWLVTAAEPVPALDSFRTQAMSTQVYTFIMSLIDGKRSIKDIAVVFEQQKLMSKVEAESAIRNFLTRMYEDSERQSKF